VSRKPVVVPKSARSIPPPLIKDESGPDSSISSVGLNLRPMSRPGLQGGVHRVERRQRASVQRPLKERHEQTVELLLLYESRPSSAARLHDEQMVGVEQPSHPKTALPAESLSVDGLGGPQRDR
jgi:hypothetical protein